MRLNTRHVRESVAHVVGKAFKRRIRYASLAEDAGDHRARTGHDDIFISYVISESSREQSRVDRFSVRSYLELSPVLRRKVARDYVGNLTNFSEICRAAELGAKGGYPESFSGIITLLAAADREVFTIVVKNLPSLWRLPTDNLDIIVTAATRARSVAASTRISLVAQMLHHRTEPRILESSIDALTELGSTFSGVAPYALGVMRVLLNQTRGNNFLTSLAEEAMNSLGEARGTQGKLDVGTGRTPVAVW